MTISRTGFKIIISLLRGAKAGVDASVKTVRDGRLARYALRELEKNNQLYTRNYFVVPTLENTSVLRDYVHHKLTKEHESLEKASYEGGKVSMLQVLKWLSDKKYRVLCGGLSQILLGIFRGLNYSAVLSNWIDLTPSHYTDSHMLVEVYIPELNKYIIQDAAYNMIVTHNGTPLNTLELARLLRNGKALENKEIAFVNNIGEEEGIFTPVKELSYDQYFRYFGQLFSWDSGSKIMYPAVKTHRHPMEDKTVPE